MAQRLPVSENNAIFKFASDVSADQTAEIGRMRNMLAESPGGAAP